MGLVVGSSKTLVIRSRYGYPGVFALCGEPTFGFSFLAESFISFVDCTRDGKLFLFLIPEVEVTGTCRALFLLVLVNDN